VKIHVVLIYCRAALSRKFVQKSETKLAKGYAVKVLTGSAFGILIFMAKKV